MTIEPPDQSGCTDFTELVVDDNVALEGDEAFTIIIDEAPSSMAMVNIVDDDSEFNCSDHCNHIYLTVQWPLQML